MSNVLKSCVLALALAGCGTEGEVTGEAERLLSSTPDKLLEAEAFSAKSSTPLKTLTSSRVEASANAYVGWTASNDFIAFNGVDLTGVTAIRLRTATPDSNVSLELRQGSPTGPLLGTAALSSTGSWAGVGRWSTATVALGSVWGVQNVYVVWRGRADLDWVQLVGSRSLEAESYAVKSATALRTLSNTSVGASANGYVGWTTVNDYVAFNGVDLTGVTEIRLRAATPDSNVSLELRQGSASGALLGKVTIVSTGGWAGVGRWATSRTAVSGVSGPQNLYVVWRGRADLDLVQLVGGSPSTNAAPVPDFSATPTTGTAPLRVQFSNQTTGAVTAWAWDFNGDGTTDSTEANPAYTYTNPGSYTVSLTATNSAGEVTKTRSSLVVVTSTPATSCTKYVSKSGSVNGQSAYTTIQAGARSLVAGDTLCVRGGTYVESVSISASGTASSPITVIAYPGELPIIDGQGTYPTSSWGALLNLGGNFINVAGFEVRNSSNLNAMGVTLIGHHNKVSRMNVHHTHQNGILVRGDYGIVEDSRVWLACLSNINGNGNGWASGLSAARDPVNGITDRAILRRNVVYTNWGEGLSAYEANGVIIEDNIVYDNYATNTYISDASNVIYRNNLVYNPSVSAMSTKHSTALLSMADEVASKPRSAKNLVINNTFLGGGVGLFSWTLVSGSGLDRVLFANNTLINARLGTGPINSGSAIRNNIFFTNNGTALASISTRSGLTLSNNLWSSTVPSNASGTGDVVGNPQLSLSGSTSSGQLTRSYFATSSSSPGRGKGTAISMSTDYVSMSSGSAVLDLGAYVGTPIPVQYQ